MVERLFLAVPWGCLQFVIGVFPDHTHLLFLMLNWTLIHFFLLLNRRLRIRSFGSRGHVIIRLKIGVVFRKVNRFKK